MNKRLEGFRKMKFYRDAKDIDIMNLKYERAKEVSTVAEF